jgi:hypothetical protein
MLLQPARIVRVTSEQELDSALGSADQVIVEGDDRLLSYAVSKASNDPQNRIAVEVDGQSITVGRKDGTGEPENVLPPFAPAQHARAERAAPVRSHALAIVMGVLVFLAILAALGAYLGLRTQFPAPSSSPSAVIAPPPEPTPQTSAPPDIVPDGLPQPLPKPVSPSTSGPLRPPPSPPVAVPPLNSATASSDVQTSAPSTGISGNLPTLAWPVVAIIAIIALYLVARQAIAGGRNVEISWKVTEKVSGRVVITKVRKRAGKQGAAA